MIRPVTLANAVLYAVYANLALPLAEADRATRRALALIEQCSRT